MIRITDALLAVGCLIIVWSFYRAQTNPNFHFDVFDLIMENGRVSRMALAFMITLAATTWMMMRMTLDGKMTEGYFTAYGAMWIAPIVAKLFSAPAPPSTTSTVTATQTTIEPVPVPKEPKP